jgi:hypothetical protein
MASAHVVLDSFESAVLVAEHMENTLVLGRKIRYVTRSNQNKHIKIRITLPVSFIRVRLAINPSRGGQSSNGQINSIYVRFSVASVSNRYLSCFYQIIMGDFSVLLCRLIASSMRQTW